MHVPLATPGPGEVNALKHEGQLQRAYLHMRRPWVRPARKTKCARLKPLSYQAISRAIPEQNLGKVSAPIEKDEKVPGERVLAEFALDDGR